ncbi:MAG: glycosyltransferase [Flavobacterium sp.]|nr:glycosyltransferase [Pedobacter sp.]
MKILQINASYKPAYIYGGPTMSVSKLCEELITAGIDTEVYTTTANGNKELGVQSGIKMRVDNVPVTYFSRVTKGNSHFSPTLLFSLWKSLRQKKSGSVQTSNTDIIHIHAWWNLVSVGSCLIALLLSKTVILSPRGTLSNYSFNNRNSTIKNIFHRVIGKALLKRCYFHVTSEKEKQDIVNILASKRITIIPNFIELGHVETMRSKTKNDEPFKLLFFSRIEEKKGLDVLLEALQLLQFPWHLTIAGTGEDGFISSLKSKASKLNLSENISWVGFQGKDNKFKCISTNDLLILPSHDESFANVVIESLSVGTPVILTEKVGLASYVIQNDFGWVCKQDKNELSLEIKTAYHEISKREKINKEAPGQIRIDFNENLLVKKYTEMYFSIK